MASPDELRTREIGDEHLPGYAELYAELAPASPDPDTLSYERGDVIDLTAYDAEYSEAYQRDTSFTRNLDVLTPS